MSKAIVFVKKFWAEHLALFAAILSFLVPSLEAYQHAHPAGFWGSLIAFVLGRLLPSPLARRS